MRIAVLTRRRAHVGGIETYADLSTGGLRARGHFVETIAEDDGDAAISARLDALRPDVVLSHGLSEPAEELEVARRWPSVFFAHEYQGTCVSGSKAFAFPAPTPCARTFGAGCLLAYFPRRCGGWSPVTMLRQFDRQRERLVAIRACRAVATLSRHIADECVRHGVSSGRVHVMPPVVRDMGPADIDVVPDVPHVLYLGRFELMKGPHVLLDAIALAAPRLGGRLDVTLAGDGSAADTVRARAAALARSSPASRVSIVAKVPPDRVRTLLASASLLAVPSLWPEPFGLVGLEAGACGVPAVAFRSGGIPEWLQHGVNGRLADTHGSAASLADAIVECLASPEVQRDLRAGARAAAAGATLPAHAARLEAVLESAAGLRPPDAGDELQGGR